MSLRLLAPAKLNLTREVIGKREDGFHEIRSVMQTIDLCDRIVLSPARPGAFRMTRRETLRIAPPRRSEMLRAGRTSARASSSRSRSRRALVLAAAAATRRLSSEVSIASGA